MMGPMCKTRSRCTFFRVIFGVELQTHIGASVSGTCAFGSFILRRGS